MACMTGTPTPILRNSLPDSLARGILALMREQHLGSGDRLPSVRDLSVHFHVAVPTLREAIRRLEAFGVVEVRHGSGIFVRTSQPPLMLANPTANSIDTQVILDLLDTRILFEPHCAECAARIPASPEVAALATILDRAGGAIDNDDAMLQEANMAFHIGVATCSGNTVLAQVMTLLTDIYSSEQSVMLTVSNQRLRDHQEHTTILAAIQAGDPVRAGDLMREHLQGVRRTIAERLPAAQAPPEVLSTTSNPARTP
jgi:GntR family transcriptional repressor for pyruvate dehydrogenase complex